MHSRNGKMNSLLIHISTIAISVILLFTFEGDAKASNKDDKLITAINLLANEQLEKGLFILLPEVVKKNRKAITIYALLQIFSGVPGLNNIPEFKENDNYNEDSFSINEIFFLNGSSRLNNFFTKEDDRRVIKKIYNDLSITYKNDPFLSKCIANKVEIYTCYEKGVLAGNFQSIDFYLNGLTKMKIYQATRRRK